MDAHFAINLAMLLLNMPCMTVPLLPSLTKKMRISLTAQHFQAWQLKGPKSGMKAIELKNEKSPKLVTPQIPELKSKWPKCRGSPNLSFEYTL